MMLAINLNHIYKEYDELRQIRKRLIQAESEARRLSEKINRLSGMHNLSENLLKRTDEIYEQSGVINQMIVVLETVLYNYKKAENSTVDSIELLPTTQRQYCECFESFSEIKTKLNGMRFI